jgi:hypothetical protein
MRKALLMIVCFMAALITPSQNVIRYDTCQLIKQYAGEWQYVNGIDTIKIYFRYHRDYSASFSHISDKLYGWHEYKKGNQVIESRYQHRFMPLPYNYDSDSNRNSTDRRSIRLSIVYCNNDSLKFIGTIFDYSQAKEMKTVTATLDPTRTIMIWKQEHSTGYGSLTGAYGMTLPRQFVLKKQ